MPLAFGPACVAARLGTLIPGFPRAEVCVAFSGGLDSTALLAALAALRRRGLRVRAIHVDHQLQPASAAWARRCRKVARTLGVPLTVLVAHVARAPGASPEAAARAARYASFAGELHPGETLVTAHHLADQAETVLLQLLRGAGIAGLSAMPARAPFGRGWHVRPLLELDRTGFETYLRRHELGWICDPSNEDSRFDRNYLRAAVMPAILARWPGAAPVMGRSARHLAAASRLLDDLAERDVADAADADQLLISRLRALVPARRANALRYWIAAGGLPMPDTRQLAEIAGPMLSARRDANPCVTWRGAEVRRYAGKLALAAAAGSSVSMLRDQQVEWNWRATPRLSLPDGSSFRITRDPRGAIDGARLPPTLSIRARRGGERLRPRIGGPTRTLKALLRESGRAPAARNSVPLVFAGDRLVIVPGIGVDGSVRARGSGAERVRLDWIGSPTSA